MPRKGNSTYVWQRGDYFLPRKDITLSVLKEVATLIPVEAVTSGRALFSGMAKNSLKANRLKIQSVFDRA